MAGVRCSVDGAIHSVAGDGARLVAGAWSRPLAEARCSVAGAHYPVAEVIHSGERKSLCGLSGLHCGKGLTLWCANVMDIIQYVNSGRLPFCLNSSRPLFDMWGHAFSGWHDEAESTLCNIHDSVVPNLCCYMDNSPLQVPVHMYIYRYRMEAHEMFDDQSVFIPSGSGFPRCHYTAIYVKHCT